MRTWLAVAVCCVFSCRAHALTLSSHRLQAEIDDATGVVTSLVDRSDGRALLNASPDHYALQPDPDHEVTAEETGDQVHARPNQATFVATNPKLPGIVITKTYSLTDRWLAKRVEFRAEGSNIGLLKYTVTSTAAPDFYRDGYLNDPSRHPIDYPYIFTRDLKSDRPIRDANAVADHHYAIYTNPKWHRGLAQYRLKVDDRFVPLLSSYSYEPGLTYSPTGWRVAVACKWMSSDRPALSAETRWQVFDGDQIRFHEDYLQLPEVKAEWDWKSPDWLQKVVAIQGWQYGSSSPRVEQLKPVVDALDGGVLLVMLGGIFHNMRSYLLDPLPTPEGLPLPAATLQDIVRRLHALSPNVKVGPMTWQWGFGDLDPVFKEHPEWTVHDDKGNPVFAATGWSDEKVYSQLLTPDCRRYDLEQYRGMQKRYDFDFIYMDTGQGGVTRFDWNTKWGAQDYDWSDFYKGIRDAARSNRDGIAFFNGTPRLYTQYADCGYFEGMGFVKVRDWRAMADRILLVKLYQPDGKWTMPLYWQQDNGDDYINYCYLLGLKPGGFGGGVSMRRWPMVEAANELRESRLIPEADAQPCWWKEYGGTGPQADSEAYALKIPGGAMLNLYYHGAKPGEVKASCLLDPLGLDPAKPVHAWLFRPKPAHDLFRATGNAACRIMQVTYLGTQTVRDGRFEATVEMEPGRVGLILLTQAPRLTFARDGRPTQFLLPATDADGKFTIAADQPEPEDLVKRRYDYEPPATLTSPLLVPEHSSYATVNHHEEPVGRAVRGIQVDKLLTIDCEHNSGDTAATTISGEGIHLVADMGDTELYGFASAGVESPNMGKLRLQVTVGEPLYKRFATNTPSCFVGLVADYHTAKGYTDRVRFGLGPCGSESLQSERPWWGAYLPSQKAPPGKYVDLAKQIMLGKPCDLTLDLGTYAPEGWDGHTIFGPALESCGLGTRVQVEIIGNGPAGPRDPKAFSALPVMRTEAGTVLFQGAHIARFEDGARLEDGRILFPPEACIEATGLTVVTWHVNRAADSKSVVLMVNYQQRDGSYRLVQRDLSSLVKPGSEAKFDIDLRQFAPDGWNGRTRIRFRGDHCTAEIVANSTFQIY